ncbi:hypothetical protein DOY81_002374 [Sarcophaga bullata]|nr:hypothetical protein DOY81_002374 [Sarcophaga bullata]
MKLSKLSNQTNSQDPQAVNSRIFVGNLNTFQCSKTDVERMFQIYGRLAGISMHKGYAFVQFTNPFDARNACLGEDGKMVLSQTLDVNMVAEPKPHQVGRKRQNVNKTGNDWDYFYDSYYSSTLNRSNSLRPKKRKRLISNSSRMVSLNDAVNNGNINAAVAAAAVAQQQQHMAQQQQHQHQQHQQQQVAAVAMAAMANLLPQQQLLLHQQNLMSNSNGATAITAAAACNGSTTTPHHTSLNVFLQQQQQHHHMKQQQQAAAAAVAAAQYAAVTNGGLQLKINSPMMTASSGQQQSITSSTTSLLTHNSDQHMSTATSPTTHQSQLLHTQHHQVQLQQQQQQTSSHLMQPLSLTLSPQQNHHNHLQQQQQKQTLQHHHQQQMQQKQLSSQSQQQLLQNQQNEQQSINQHWGPFKVYSNPDTLICGNCRECFNELAELLDHKRSYCKLRFTCKCQDITLPIKNPPIGAKLLCAVCKDGFSNPWDLMVHAQAAHMVNIYELGNEHNNTNNSFNNTSNSARISTNGNNNLSTDNHLPAAEDFDNISATTNYNNNNINNKEANNNNLHCTIDNNDTNNNNNNKNHNNNNTNSNNSNASVNGTMPLSQTTTCFSMPDVKMSTQNTQQSSVVNTNGTTMDMAIMNATNGNTILSSSSLLGDGSNNTSDTEAHLSMELKFGICNSPVGSISNKEDGNRDDLSLDERMSDDIKMINTNGSLSSRGSSPAMDNDEISQPQRACIVRTLSIETTTANTPTTKATLGLIPNNLALSLTNATATKTAAALAPQ